jgi:hypothetical protein
MANHPIKKTYFVFLHPHLFSLCYLTCNSADTMLSLPAVPAPVCVAIIFIHGINSGVKEKNVEVAAVPTVPIAVADTGVK